MQEFPSKLFCKSFGHFPINLVLLLLNEVLHVLDAMIVLVMVFIIVVALFDISPIVSIQKLFEQVVLADFSLEELLVFRVRVDQDVVEVVLLGSPDQVFVLADQGFYCSLELLN